MAGTGQLSRQSPHPLHNLFLKIIPPPVRSIKAPVLQAAAHGAESQAKQWFATNPVESPPEEWMRIPAVFHDTRP